MEEEMEHRKLLLSRDHECSFRGFFGSSKEMVVQEWEQDSGVTLLV